MASINLAQQVQKDYFCVSDGVEYAGKHLIIDLWGAKKIDDLEFIESTLKQMVQECCATLLNIYLHKFSPSGGISGVAVLSESDRWPAE